MSLLKAILGKYKRVKELQIENYEKNYKKMKKEMGKNKQVNLDLKGTNLGSKGIYPENPDDDKEREFRKAHDFFKNKELSSRPGSSPAMPDAMDALGNTRDYINRPPKSPYPGFPGMGGGGGFQSGGFSRLLPSKKKDKKKEEEKKKKRLSAEELGLSSSELLIIKEIEKEDSKYKLSEDEDIRITTPHIEMLLSKKEKEEPIEEKFYLNGIIKIIVDNIEKKIKIEERKISKGDGILVKYFLKMLIIEKISLDNRNLEIMFKQIKTYVLENSEKEKKKIDDVDALVYQVMKNLTYHELTPLFLIEGVEDIHGCNGNYVFVKMRKGDYQTDIDYKLKLSIDLNKEIEKLKLLDLEKVYCKLHGDISYSKILIGEENGRNEYFLNNNLLEIEIKEEQFFEEEEDLEETQQYMFNGKVEIYKGLKQIATIQIKKECKMLSNDIKYIVKKLAELCNKELSFNNKIIDGILPNGGRLAEVYKCNGIDFNMRIPADRIFSIVNLIKFGMIDPISVAYIWLVTESDFCKYKICGPTGSAKTTLLKALTCFIPKKVKVITIEDVPELDFRYHINWVQNITNVESGATMAALLKSSLRRRPEYLMVGEIRTADEAEIMIECFATAHKGISTMHVDSYDSAKTRILNSFKIDPQSMKEITMYIFLKVINEGAGIKRYVFQIVETNKKNIDKPNVVFDWDGKNKRMFFTGQSIILANYGIRYGMTRQQVANELKCRVNIINFLCENNITDHKDVLEFINLYTTDPENFEKKMKEFISNKKEKLKDIEKLKEEIKKEVEKKEKASA